LLENARQAAGVLIELRHFKCTPDGIDYR
jgi:hypothetical protein